ncbi:hypothetical protein EEB12_01180 [Rhodococcus sp. WS1]|uniref:hypothetical protein n=1 Tax=unclassified Rhodococcus (in: high G+C Gram-positive bacteria) TaxID=192944 RepID=UPI001141BA1C|nr:MULTISPECIES: hypothetical protein [unclassified Rhodococcus (in: high G+C Gram-positive bacteria)]ROZ58673.1 hypothetical protein EEB12_01180 [Rhodococcus sp. WS1]TQC38615.1 hypothetical protein EEB16_10405 [Rhodococcus sp. WS7]
MAKKLLSVLGVLAFVGLVVFGASWLYRDNDADQNTVYITRTVQPTQAAADNVEFLECVKTASKHLESIGIEREQAIAQAKTSPRCSPLR